MAGRIEDYAIVGDMQGGVRATAGPDAIWLRTPVRLSGHDLAHTATFAATPKNIDVIPGMSAGACQARSVQTATL